MTTPDKDPKLTPTEDLICELLTARHRLGEQIWTLNSNSSVVSALDSLKEKGIADYKSGVVGGTVLAWLTDEGKEEFMSTTYISPLEKDLKGETNE